MSLPRRIPAVLALCALAWEGSVHAEAPAPGDPSGIPSPFSPAEEAPGPAAPAKARAPVPPAAAPATPPPAASPVAAPKRAPSSGSVSTPKAHSVSEGTASMLAAGLPKYAPPKPEPEVPESEQVDLRDVDKPKNTIIRLPKYVVHPPPSPVLREQDVNTQKGLGALAAGRYLSEFDRGVLNRFTVPFFGQSPETRALQRYREEQRLSAMADLKDTAYAIQRGGDEAESVYIRRVSQDTYMRHDDWGGPVPTK